MSAPDPTGTDQPADPAAEPEHPSARSRPGNPAFGDIVRSMLVMGVILVALFGIGRLFWGNDAPDRPPVDYATTVTQVRDAAPYDVYAPTSLPDGWRSNGVTFEPGTQGRWHLGVLTENDEYIGLEEQNESPRVMVETYAPDTEVVDEVEVGGETWQLRSGGGETTFVRTDGDLTVLVTGSAPREDVEAFIDLLSATEDPEPVTPD
ncbi:uncharacterized protein DUF4245 [Mumia flava]|uniref:Uncharacterized protein DUF4245 n=1 Tax=Mumia flava TaxID=1348852 RepID=A0A2M9BFQ8_9ACTN|nr:DUF4245 domain-containing protein [Mumia flava]PJJ56778.1 uncharacterized protein DUF4245 [Mumia flava]